MVRQEVIKKIKKLPESPGVYYLLDKKGNILYIGKATSLRDRVRSYFNGDIFLTRGPIIASMIEAVSDVKFTKTDSVLEALILEAELIKKIQPKHNIREKDDKSFNYVVITKENYPRVLILRGKELSDLSSLKTRSYKLQAIYGPFPEAGILREALKILRKIFPWRDRCIPFEELKDKTKAKPCFNAQIGLCPGVCIGKISKEDYSENIFNLKMFFAGKKKLLIKKLEKEMKGRAAHMEFEKAGEIKKTIFALTHIHDVSLMKKELSREVWSEEKTLRIEAYDISHTSGNETVGSMTVVENGQLKKSDYRKFKIIGDFGVNDTASLKEVLERRIRHKEWPLPDVVAVDGGLPQKKIAEEIFSGTGAEIVAVVKNSKHQPEKILGDEKISRKFKKEILLANGEAHRFAIAFHKKRRSGKFGAKNKKNH